MNVRSAPSLKLAISINAVPMSGGGSRYKLTGPGGPEEGSGFDYAACVYVFLSFPLVAFVHCTN